MEIKISGSVLDTLKDIQHKSKDEYIEVRHSPMIQNNLVNELYDLFKDTEIYVVSKNFKEHNPNNKNEYRFLSLRGTVFCLLSDPNVDEQILEVTPL